MEMATSISDTGLTIGQMARASTLTLMVRTMMAIGSMTSTTALARKSGRTVQSLKVTTVMARSMDMGSLFGRIGAPSRVTSSRTKWKGTESTSGLTDESTTASGRITNSMGMGTLRGKMGASTAEATSMTSVRAREFSNGPTVASTMVVGYRVASTALPHTRKLMGRSSVECGSLASARVIGYPPPIPESMSSSDTPSNIWLKCRQVKIKENENTAVSPIIVNHATSYHGSAIF